MGVLGLLSVTQDQKMNNDAAASQVAHMKEFILHEAKEKADEIHSKAEQDYTVEKQRLVEEEKLRLKKDFDRRQANVELESKIANATETNQKKLLVFQAASGEVEKTFAEAFEELKKVPSDKVAYQALLTDLIPEGAKRLDLPAAVVRCRAEDKGVVEAAIKGVKENVSFTIDDTPLTVDNSVTMTICEGVKECIGGVHVLAPDGKVCVPQTLNARLQVAFDTSFPVIKPLLFNQGGSKNTYKAA